MQHGDNFALRVTPLKENPHVIDEIAAENIQLVLIWRENKHEYGLTIGDKTFVFESSERRGAGIQVVCPQNNLGTSPLIVNSDEGDTVQVRPLVGQPGVVSQAEGETIGSVHIERMDRYLYLAYIGPVTFHFQTAASRGPWIHLVG